MLTTINKNKEVKNKKISNEDFIRKVLGIIDNVEGMGSWNVEKSLIDYFTNNNDEDLLRCEVNYSYKVDYEYKNGKASLISIAYENHFIEFFGLVVEKYPDVAYEFLKKRMDIYNENNSKYYPKSDIFNVRPEKFYNDVLLKLFKQKPEALVEFRYFVLRNPEFYDLLPEIIKFDTKFLEAKDEKGRNAIFEARKEEILLKIMEINPKLMLEQDNDGKTFLHYDDVPENVMIKAIETYPELAEILDNEGNSFLVSRAKNFCHDKFAKICNKIAEVNPKAFTNKKSAEILCYNTLSKENYITLIENYPEIFEYKYSHYVYLKFDPERDYEDTIAQFQYKNVDLLRELAKRKPEILAIQNKGGYTALHYHADIADKTDTNRFSNTILNETLFEDVLEVASELLEIQSKNGRICLSILADVRTRIKIDGGLYIPIKGTLVSKVLVKALDKNPKLGRIKDNLGNTIYHYCAKSMIIAPILKGLEVDPDSAKIKNKNGNTYLNLVGTYWKGVYLKAREVNPELVEIKGSDGKSMKNRFDYVGEDEKFTDIKDFINDFIKEKQLNED